MIPYIALVGIPAIFCFAENRVSPLIKRKNVGITLFFIILFILLCLRGIICGIDLTNYKYMFLTSRMEKRAITKYLSLNGEVLFILYEKAIRFFTSNFQIYLSITAAISLIPMYIFFKRESEIPFLTIALFLCVGTFSMYFSGIRQAMAIGLSIPAWYLAKHKKLIFFILVVFCALLIHSSAIIMILIYPLYHIKIKRKWLIFVIPVMVLLFVFNKPVFEFLGTMLGSYNEKYIFSTTSTGAYAMLILFIAFAVFSFVIPDESKLDSDIIAMRNIMLLIVIFQCYAPLNSLAMRMNYYFLFIIPVLIPKIIKRSSKRKAQLAVVAKYVLIVFFTAYFFYQGFFIGTKLGIFPYVPFWR